ncbi:hypothetical protein Cni_G17835 [Canna indica]|uniref:ATP-dependent Clp protease proteolytic subunit n=1 Tax=Canna indica TaxID=4628 RepID=A0AAQ3KJJ5_9LILI|nr:hypothetical protein Cni_G17835 [Canna indica]
MNESHWEQVALYARHIGKSPEQIEEDIKRPKYFSPSEAVEYGIIDKELQFSNLRPNDLFFEETVLRATEEENGRLSATDHCAFYDTALGEYWGRRDGIVENEG